MNYPNGKKPNINNNILKAPRVKQAIKSHLGIDFEDMINKSNSYYLSIDKAIIYKKPTPIRITKVDYPSRKRAKIVEAYYQIPSTTDYNGIYKGKYIDFEAKSCNGKSFPFTNLYHHQIHHLENVMNHGGIAFLIILYNDYHETFVLEASILVKLYKDSLKGGRKSISYDFIKTYGHQVKMGINPPLDYLQIIDELYFKE